MHRGRRVSLAFTMQGWGQFAQQGILLLLLLAFNSGSLEPPFSEPTAQATFRVSFALTIPITAWLAWRRYNTRYPGDEQLKAAKKRLKVSAYDIKSLKLASSHYYGRLIGTGVVWFVNGESECQGSGSDVRRRHSLSLLHAGVSAVADVLPTQTCSSTAARSSAAYSFRSSPAATARCARRGSII